MASHGGVVPGRDFVVIAGMREWRRWGKFNAVGLLGATLQLALLWVFVKDFQLPVVCGTPLAVELVILHNFVWHERFTWRDRRVKGTRERAIMLWRFHVGNGVISLVGNTVLTYCFTQWLGVRAMAAAIASILVCSVLNFVVAERWVYVG